MPDIWMDVDTALSEVPVNIQPLIDDTDFKTRETAVAYDAAGMDLVWNFVTTGGAYTQTAVTPTTAGNYDWANQGDGMYSIEIPASGGASINNDTEGFGWFTGVATGILPWRGPIIGFRAAGLNNKMIDDAYSTTRGLAGTALPDAAADAAGGLPISDAGGLDLDAQIGTKINDILTDTGTTLDDKINTIDDFLDTEIAAILAAVDTEVAAILADTNELQTDWVNGGRLDLLLDATLADTNELQTDWANGGRLDLIVDAILDDTDLIDDGTSGLAKIATDVAAILVDTGTTLDGKLDTIDDFLDTEIAAILAAVDTEVAAILADTNELQTDWANGGRLDLIIDAILVDTGTTLQAELDGIQTIVEAIPRVGETHRYTNVDTSATADVTISEAS